MCGSKPKVDTSVQDAMLQETRDARLREEERQARIEEGTAAVDSTFNTFDDSYYDGIVSNYMDYYQPQLDNQFDNATDDLTFALARAGTLNSSIAANKQADLTTQYNDALSSFLSQATGAANQQRQRVGQEKSSLISLLNQTADADRIANEALARTQQIYQEQPSYNPIGDLFGGFAVGVGNYLDQRRQRQLYDTYFNGGPTTGSGYSVTE